MAKRDPKLDCVTKKRFFHVTNSLKWLYIAVFTHWTSHYNILYDLVSFITHGCVLTGGEMTTSGC